MLLRINVIIVYLEQMFQILRRFPFQNLKISIFGSVFSWFYFQILLSDKSQIAQ